jgi:hypothetical protein
VGILLEGGLYTLVVVDNCTTNAYDLLEFILINLSKPSTGGA